MHRSKSFLRRTVTLLIAGFVFFSTISEPWAQSTLWQDRRKSAQRLAENGLQADQDPQTLLAQLPLAMQERMADAAPMASTVLKGLESLPQNSHISKIVSSLAPYGTVQDIQTPAAGKTKGKGPVVIYIQDVHARLEQQRNIASMIQKTLEVNPKTLIGLEGMKGDLDVKRWRHPSPSINRKTATFFLNIDYFSGTDYVALTSPEPARMYGVEDKTLYLNNVQAIKDSAAARPGVLSKIQEWEKTLEARKASVFTPALKDMDAKAKGYADGSLRLTAYLSALVAHPAAPALPAHSHIAQYMEALKTEESLDFNKVEKERNELLSALVERLEKPRLQDLVQQSVSFRSGYLSYADFYQYLRGLTTQAGLSLANYAHFDRYVQYVLRSDNIDPEALYQEIGALETKIWTALCQTPEQKALYEQSRDLTLLDKLVRLAFTTDEWASYASRRAEIHALTDRLAQKAFAGALRPFETFYDMAEARNTALVDNLMTKWNRDASEDSPAVVLVAGGFHSAGLKKLFTEKGITAVTLSPKFEGEVTGEGNEYLDVFLHDKMPLEQIFESPKISVQHESSLANPMSGGQNPRAETILPLVESTLEITAKQGIAVERQGNGAIVTSDGARTNEGDKIAADLAAEGAIEKERQVVDPDGTIVRVLEEEHPAASPRNWRNLFGLLPRPRGSSSTNGKGQPAGRSIPNALSIENLNLIASLIPGQMNTELSGQLPSLVLDDEHRNLTGAQLLQELLSGKYTAEHFRLGILKLGLEGQGLPETLMTALSAGSALSSAPDQEQTVRDLVQAIIHRSADITAAIIAGITRGRLNAQEPLSIELSSFYGQIPDYLQLVTARLQQLMGDEAGLIQITIAQAESDATAADTVATLLEKFPKQAGAAETPDGDNGEHGGKKLFDLLTASGGGVILATASAELLGIPQRLFIAGVLAVIAAVGIILFTMKWHKNYQLKDLFGLFISLSIGSIPLAIILNSIFDIPMFIIIGVVLVAAAIYDVLKVIQSRQRVPVKPENILTLEQTAQYLNALYLNIKGGLGDDQVAAQKLVIQLIINIGPIRKDILDGLDPELLERLSRGGGLSGSIRDQVARQHLARQLALIYQTATHPKYGRFADRLLTDAARLSGLSGYDTLSSPGVSALLVGHPLSEKQQIAIQRAYQEGVKQRNRINDMREWRPFDAQHLSSDTGLATDVTAFTESEIDWTDASKNLSDTFVYLAQQIALFDGSRQDILYVRGGGRSPEEIKQALRDAFDSERGRSILAAVNVSHFQGWESVAQKIDNYFEIGVNIEILPEGPASPLELLARMRKLHQNPGMRLAIYAADPDNTVALPMTQFDLQDPDWKAIEVYSILAGLMVEKVLTPLIELLEKGATLYDIMA